MGLESGKKLAHFSIETKLGEGGMGEVYRAVDQKLDRKVAIKVLPEVVANSAERLGRFEREAKALAALNHPNVAGIHQVEHVEGTHFLVMELAEGQTLAQRIEAGRIPLEQALPIALQIAEGLESAHDRGIIHRDLKPANVMLAPDGTVKVLDFGLARAMDSDSPDSVPGVSLASHSPTFTAHMTGAGMLLGTAAYMSPEQARGEVADRRADIWAFGVVLFEMLSGETVYAGKTISDTLAGVLAREPVWDQLPGDLPGPIRKLLERCLNKEASERLQAIGEARIALRNYINDPSGAAEATEAEAAGPAGSGWGRVAMVGIPLLLLGAIGAWFLKPGSPDPLPREIEASLAVDGLQLMPGISSSVVLSRDGSKLAYFTGIGTNPLGRVRIRDMHRIVVRELDDIDRAYNVFFSPDGNWLGYVTPTVMYKVAVSGGAPLQLASVNRSRGASWGRDGVIVFAPTQSSPLSSVPAVGGEPTLVSEFAEGEVSHRYPHHLPGDRYVLYTAYSGGDTREGVIKVLDLESGESEVVHRGGTFARFTASGHLLFWSKGSIYAAPFDLKTRRTNGIPAPVVQGVSGNSEGGAHFDVDDEGTLVYVPGGATETEEARNTLKWIDRDGNMSALSEVAGGFGNGFTLSPDQRTAAVTRWVDGNGDVWLIDIERATMTRLTFDDGPDIDPIWSPDGKTLYFSARRGGLFHVFRKSADGSDEASTVWEGDHDHFAHDISSDGRWILFHENHPENEGDLWVYDLQEKTAAPFLTTPFDEESARFSPDGKWIAYVSNESGDYAVYVRPFPGPGGKWQISSDRSGRARWSTDGKSILYLTADRELMEVSIEVEGSALRAGRPERVIQLDGQFQSIDNWSVSRDGSRFAFIQGPEDGFGATGLDHVLVRFTFDWFNELEETLEIHQ